MNMSHSDLSPSRRKEILRDEGRLKALTLTGLMDSPPDEDFDRLTRLTSNLLDAPVVMVTLVAGDRHYYKSMVGLSPEPPRCSLDPFQSFCQHAVILNEMVVINDIQIDPIYTEEERENPINLVAYLGTPLRTPDNKAIGSLCAIEHKPRTWTKEDKKLLAEMGELVMKEIALWFYANENRSIEKALSDRTDELALSQQRLNLAFEAINIGLFEWDMEHDNVNMSAELLAQIGEKPSREWTKSESFFARIHPEDAEGLKMAMNAYLAKLTPQFDVSFRWRHKDGSYRWILSRGKATWNEQGHPVRMLGIHVDITEQQNAIELKQQRDTLARLVEVKTQAIRKVNEELETKNQELLRANKVKDEFLATMSHEIRTPMNGVIGFTSLLLDTDLNFEQRDYVDTIRASGDALLAIINDVLDYSKIESGAIELEEHTFILHQCIEEALDTITLKAYKKGLELIPIVDPCLPNTVNGDARRLRQILVNLLGNAVKFTEKGQIVIKAFTKNAGLKRGDKFMLHVSVQDTGIGIPQNKFEKIFESFSQADASTARRYGGTGLGLSISQALCNLMGGKIWLDSEENIGSTFHFTVMLESADSKADPNMNGASFLQEKRLLISSVSEPQQHLIKNQCVPRKIQPYFVSSNKELNHLLKEKKGCYDAILVDPDYSDISEAALAGVLKEWNYFAPIILMSNLGSTYNSDAFTPTAVIHKPIKRFNLYSVLEESIRKKPNTASTQDCNPPEFTESIKTNTRILVAEDNIINQKLIGRYLKLLGYHGDIVDNGVKAIDVLSEKEYDILLLDVNMPVMDGLETTRILRSREGLPNDIHIIGITAGLEIKERNRCIDAGMNDFLGKPMTINELEDTLSRALHRLLADK